MNVLLANPVNTSYYPEYIKVWFFTFKIFPQYKGRNSSKTSRFISLFAQVTWIQFSIKFPNSCLKVHNCVVVDKKKTVTIQFNIGVILLNLILFLKIIINIIKLHNHYKNIIPFILKCFLKNIAFKVTLLQCFASSQIINDFPFHTLIRTLFNDSNNS